MRAILLPGLVAGALALVTTACGARVGPNVLLVTIDTLRADHLSCYGYPRETSPALDAFLGRGVRFEWALAPAPLTAPSHASIMTGAYPSFHTVGIHNGDFALAEREETLAELCSRRGMTTAAVVSNPVLGRFVGLDQGFDRYDDDFSGSERNREFADRIAADAIDKTIASLEDLGDGPFFFWLHLQDPHGPYDPPRGPVRWSTPGRAAARLDRVLAIGADDVGHGRLPAYQRLEDRRTVGDYVDRYDAEIRYLDDQLARLFAWLETNGRLDDTLVVFTADHGEALGEEGFFFAHGHSVGLDQVRVPLGFVGPEVPAGRVRDVTVSALDVFATLVDALDLELPEGSASRSLWPIVRRDDATALAALEARPVYTESATQRGAVLGGAYVRRNIVDFAAQPAPDAGRTDWRSVRLGETFTDLGGRSLRREPDRELRALADFHARAESSLERLDSRRRRATISERDRERLERLGYTR